VRKLDGKFDEAAINAATKTARETWTGTQFDGAGRAEASPGHARRVAWPRPVLRGERAVADRFKLLSVALFGALGDASPLDPEVYA
jgi:hypothetical protein